MFTSIATIISTIAVTAAALPSSAITAQESRPFAEWPATNFIEGCSPGGCVAAFNISAPAGYITAAPAFNVACHPIYIQQGWLNCDVVGEPGPNPTSHVQSMWTEASQRELIKISVAHVWTDGRGQRTNATGSVEVVPGTVGFDVPVTLITAVL
ncbi:uncharacterized protein PG998_003720 [Apiospora kogelbergensis]|uniref:Secreted protein n=1 Tax=Apiospora kogelbergensis TaxID=1337665 RepID=A0AAW0QIE4_9PEZI